MPLAITLPILGLVIWVAVGRATRSLTYVNQQVASRHADNLTPLDVADAPSEIGALVTSLNQLFERVHGLIEQERRFTADAAHELRTPLAGIRTQAPAVSFQPAPLELAAVLKGAIGDLAAAGLAKGMDIELTSEQHVLVSGDAGLLAILFRNLIDDALRYSPPATRVAIQIEAGDDEALVRITDAGPGISASERANIGRRFYRASPTTANASASAVRSGVLVGPIVIQVTPAAATPVMMATTNNAMRPRMARRPPTGAHARHWRASAQLFSLWLARNSAGHHSIARATVAQVDMPSQSVDVARL